MAEPTEIDFILIKLGNAADPEVFAVLCGIQDASVNHTASSSDRFVRDCANPGAVPYRKTKVSGRQLDITGSGLTDTANIVTLQTVVGTVKNYKIEAYRDDGTTAGALLGTYAGAFRLNASNINVPREGEASAEITLASHGAWTYTAA